MFGQNNKQERGQVGIGTLIVFIALVLVAAIAAGVLINTAGFLQSQAEATGQESTSQVSNSVDLISAVGSSSGSTLTLAVKLQSGSDPINLNDVEIQLIGSATDTLGSTTTLNSDGAVTSIPAITAVDETNKVLEDPGDRYQIVIDMTSTNNLSLGSGDELDMTLTTPSGSQTFERLQVSDPADFPEDL